MMPHANQTTKMLTFPVNLVVDVAHSDEGSYYACPTTCFDY